MKQILAALGIVILAAGNAFADEIDDARRLLKEIEEKSKQAVELLDRAQPGTPPTPNPPYPPTGSVDFPVVAMRMPRNVGDGSKDHRRKFNELGGIPEATKPYSVEPGTVLVLINPDGTEEVLVDSGPAAAAMDPFVSYDAKRVYYAVARDVAITKKGARIAGQADLFVIDLASRRARRITQQPGGAISHLNTGPCPFIDEYGDERLMFTKATSPVPYAQAHVPQVWAIDADGANEEKVGFLHLGAALHPRMLADGRVAVDQAEIFGLRGGQWGTWVYNPDGTDWGPLISAYESPTGIGQILHFNCELPNRKLVVADYYNGKNHGFGVLMQFDHSQGFGSPNERVNPRLKASVWQRPFQPVGMENLTPDSTMKDVSAGRGGAEWNGDWVGKWTHPAQAPGGLLATWSGPSPTNAFSPADTPCHWGIIAYIPGTGVWPQGMIVKPVEKLGDFVIVARSDDHYYLQPQAVATYRQKMGIDHPAARPWLPQEQHEELPTGTPYFIIGSDSLYTRESKAVGSWTPSAAAGGDADAYDNSEIEYLRILLQELDRDSATATNSYRSKHAPERLKILGDVPVRRFQSDGSPVLDAAGNPDTSFRIKMPANQAFTFQWLDKDKAALGTAFTWHMGRPGEVHDNCKGCHAHHQPSTLVMAETYAGTHPPVDLTRAAPETYDYQKDIQPILEEHCNACHDGSNPDAMNLHEHLSSYYKRRLHHTQPAVPFHSRTSEIIRRLRLPVDDPQHMPNDGTSLSKEQIETFIKWIDTGVQDRKSDHDSQPPTLHIETPRRRVTEPIRQIVFGAADIYGIESISVRADWSDGELFHDQLPVEGVYTIRLPRAHASGTITVKVVDRRGNITRQTRRFELREQGDLSAGT